MVNNIPAIHHVDSRFSASNRQFTSPIGRICTSIFIATLCLASCYTAYSGIEKVMPEAGMVSSLKSENSSNFFINSILGINFPGQWTSLPKEWANQKLKEAYENDNYELMREAVEEGADLGVQFDEKTLLSQLIDKKRYEDVSWLILEKSVIVTEENIKTLVSKFSGNKYENPNPKLFDFLIGNHERPLILENFKAFNRLLRKYRLGGLFFQKDKDSALVKLGINPSETRLSEEESLVDFLTVYEDFAGESRFTENPPDTIQKMKNRLENHRKSLQKSLYAQKLASFIENHLNQFEEQIINCINAYSNQIIRSKHSDIHRNAVCPHRSLRFRFHLINALVEKGSFSMIPNFLRVLTPARQADKCIEEQEYKHALSVTMDKEVNLSIRWPDNDDYLVGGPESVALYLSEAVALAASEIKAHPSLPKEEIQFLSTLLSQLEEHLGVLALEDPFIRLDLHSIQDYDWNRTSFLVFNSGFKNHAVKISLERNNDGTYRVSVYNAGGGVDKHSRWKNTEKYLTHLTFDKVPAEDVLDQENIRKMAVTHANAEDLYDFLSRLTKRGVRLEDPSDEQYYQTVQSEGTCSGQSAAAWMRHFIMKTSNSKWEALGRYKYIKALVRKHLLLNSLDGMPEQVLPYVNQKIEKYKQEALLFEMYAQDERLYNRTIEVFGPLIESSFYKEATSVKNSYERFSILLVILNKFADEKQENISLADLDLISQIIKNRTQQNKETVERTMQRLYSFSNKTEAEEVANKLYAKFHFLRAHFKVVDS